LHVLVTAFMLLQVQQLDWIRAKFLSRHASNDMHVLVHSSHANLRVVLDTCESFVSGRQQRCGTFWCTFASFLVPDSMQVTVLCDANRMVAGEDFASFLGPDSMQVTVLCDANRMVAREDFCLWV
jgi:hypothetical protein